MARKEQQQDPLDRYMRMYGYLGPEGQINDAIKTDELQQRQVLEQYARQHGFPNLATMKMAQEQENQQGGRDLRKQALEESKDTGARELAKEFAGTTGGMPKAQAILDELARRKGLNVTPQQTGNLLDKKLKKVAQATGGKVSPLLARPQEQTGTAEPLVAEGATGGVSSGGTTNYEFHPSALVQNPAAEGLGKVLGAEAQIAQGQAGTRHLDMSGNEITGNQNPFTNGIFKSASERYADMANHTGAYAPTDARARLASQAGGAPVPPVGRNLGPDIELPEMNAAQRKQTELTYAPRVAAPGYEGRGMPTPVAGSVRNDPGLTVSKPPNFAPSQLTEPKFAAGNPPTNEKVAARPELRPATNEEPMATSGLITGPTPATPTAGGDIFDNQHIMAGLKALGQYFNVPKLPEEQKRRQLATAP